MVIALALGLAAATAPLAASPITTDMVVETANISGLALSPDGKLLAYRIVRGSIEKDKMLVDWFVAPTDGRSFAIFMAHGGEALFNYAGSVAPELPVWGTDSQTLFFRARLNGSVQIWAARAGRPARQITDDPADIVSFALTADGSGVQYRVGATRADIRRAAKRIYDEGLLVDGMTDLAMPVAGGLVVDGERVIQRYTGNWGEKVPLLNGSPLATRTVAVPGVAPPESVVRVPDKDSERGRIRVVSANSRATIFVDRADGTSIECPASACGTAPVSAVWIPGQDALLVSNENSHVPLSAERLGRTWLRIWRPGQTTSRTLVEQPGTLAGSAYSSVPCAITPATAFCVQASAASPPRLVAVDLATGRQPVVDDPNAGLRHAITSPVRPLDWQVGGINYHGELLLPNARGGAFPLVLYYYTSRGFLAGAFGEALPVQPLLKAGIAVLVMDKALLGETVYNAERNYDVAVKGITAIIDSLGREGTIDRSRVGAWGLSFGSEVVNRLVRRTKLLKTASLASLQLTESFYWANAFPGKDMQAKQKEEFGVDWPDKAPDVWARLAPSRNTASLSVPVLLQMPEAEARWMGEFVGSALRDGRPVEMHALADETHILKGPRHKRAALERNLDWFRYWLTGERDTDPTKAAQYARWDGLARMAAHKVVDRSDP